MKTIVEKLQAKADAIARRYRGDVDYIEVITGADEECDDYGRIVIEIYEWGGPKMRDGRIIGDHDSRFAEYDLDQFARTLGAKLIYRGAGDDIERHKILTYWVVFDETIKGDTKKG